MDAETVVWACKKCGRCGKADQCSCGGSRAQLPYSVARRLFMEKYEPATGWADPLHLIEEWRKADEN